MTLDAGRTRKRRNTRAPQKPPINWPAVTAFLAGREGKRLGLYGDLVAAFESGSVPGGCPSRSQFYRKYAGQGGEFSCPDPCAAPDTPAEERSNARPRKKAGSRKLVAALERLEQVRNEHEATARELVDAGLFTREDQARFRQRVIRADSGQLHWLAKQGTKAVNDLAAELEHVTATYRERLAAFEESSKSQELVGDSTTAVVPTAPAPLINGIDPSNPIYGTGHPSRWGEGASEVPQPEHGQSLGRAKEGRTEELARARALIIAPVLSGILTAQEAQDHWRACFAAVARESGSPGVPGISRDTCLKFRSISRRQISRMLSTVQQEIRTAARLGIPEPALVDILSHRYPDSRRGPQDPSLRDEAQKLFLLNPHWNATNVADHLRAVGRWQGDTRTINRYINEIPDREVMLARGGPAGPEMLRMRLIRQAEYPNRVWHIDNSFIQHEVVDPDYNGPYEDEITTAFASMEFVVEDTNQAGWCERRRVTGLWITRIVDMCTRRTMALRVWSRPPNTLTTLLALRDAIERFGLPDILYSDNGADLKNLTVFAVLNRVGIFNVHSFPYTPQGGGLDERGNLTIKRKILPHLIGFRGSRHPQQWNVKDLRTPLQLETEIRSKVEQWMDNAVNRTTRRVPTQHYDEEIGARELKGLGRREVPPEAWLPLLMVVEDAVIHQYGVEVGGHLYYTEAFSDCVNGRTARIYQDPDRPRFVHVAVIRPDGNLEYMGLARRYTGADDPPPPPAWEQHQLEAEWRKEQEATRLERERVRLLEERVQEATATGQAIGNSLAVSVAEEIRSLAGVADRPALPPPAPSSPEAALADDPPSEPGHLADHVGEKQHSPDKPESLEEYLRQSGRAAPVVVNPFDA